MINGNPAAFIDTVYSGQEIFFLYDEKNICTKDTQKDNKSMALSFDIRLTWEQFWENQQNNPNCELAFLYEGKIYYLYCETYQKRIWGIFESGIDPECCGRESFGKCLVENYDELQKHHRYPTDEEWKSSMDSCYKVLTAPIWNGKSFKDVIDSIIFES